MAKISGRLIGNAILFDVPKRNYKKGFTLMYIAAQAIRKLAGQTLEQYGTAVYVDVGVRPPTRGISFEKITLLRDPGDPFFRDTEGRNLDFCEESFRSALGLKKSVNRITLYVHLFW